MGRAGGDKFLGKWKRKSSILLLFITSLKTFQKRTVTDFGIFLFKCQILSKLKILISAEFIINESSKNTKQLSILFQSFNKRYPI